MKKIETKLLSSELEIGMHVIRLDRPWLDTEFLIQGFIIQTQTEIDDFKRLCEYVFIEGQLAGQKLQKLKTGQPNKNSGKTKEKASNGKQQAKSSLPKRKVNYINRVSFNKEFSKAKVTFKEARQLAHTIMDDIRIGKTLDINQAREAVSSCVESVLRNPDALLWLTQIKKRDDYTAEHSMNVCILSATFARHLGMMESEIEIVALCGLLHDVGKAKIPLEVLNKSGMLDEEEFKIMKMHTVYGRDLLMNADNRMAITMDVAHSHHERMDGFGYPRQLKPSKMPFYAKIVAIPDTYDAITSNRCYENGRSSMQALKIIGENSGKQFDPELASQFIKCIGIFPPGTIVEMTTGEVGIVIAAQRGNRLKPKVILLLDEDKQKRENKRVVDMMKVDLDAGAIPYVIARELANHSYDIDLADYMDQGLVLQTEDLPSTTS